MERKTQTTRPSIEGLEGRMLLSGSQGASAIAQFRGVNSLSPLAQTSTNTTFNYQTPQGAKVAIKLVGPGNLAGTGLDQAGDLNLVFSGTTVFSAIFGTVKGGPGTANLASITTEALPLASLSGVGGDLIGRVLLPSFNLVPGGQVNLTAGVQSFSLNSVANGSQVHLRDTPLNNSLGLQSYVNTVTGDGVTYAQLSSTSTGATTSSASGLASGTSIGVATGSSGSGGVTTINPGTLNPTAVGFGGGAVGAINGAIPIINTVGNGENFLGTPGLTQAQVSQGRTTNYVVGTDGGSQLASVAGTFIPGVNLIEPSDVSRPAGHRAPPPGVIVNIKKVGGGPTAKTPPLGDPLIYGYDAKANALLQFDATTGAITKTISLPASNASVGGVTLARDGNELVALVARGTKVLAFDATTGDSVGQFSIANLVGQGFATITGIATAGQTTVLADALDGPTGTIQAIDVTQSLAAGMAVTTGQPFSPAREFALAGTLAGVPGTGNVFALGSGFFDTAQPNLKQAGILTVALSTTIPTELARTVFVNRLTGLDVPAGPNNGIAGTTSIALGSVDAYLAVDLGVANGVNVVRLYTPNSLALQSTLNLQDANPLADLSQSFHPELNSTALIDVQGNVQSFTAKSIQSTVLNVAGNFDQLTATTASDTSVIGLPFSHVSIKSRTNVSILTNSRLIGARNGVTVNPGQLQVGPLYFA